MQSVDLLWQYVCGHGNPVLVPAFDSRRLNTDALCDPCSQSRCAPLPPLTTHETMVVQFAVNPTETSPPTTTTPGIKQFNSRIISDQV